MLFCILQETAKYSVEHWICSSLFVNFFGILLDLNNTVSRHRATTRQTASVLESLHQFSSVRECFIPIRMPPVCIEKFTFSVHVLRIFFTTAIVISGAPRRCELLYWSFSMQRFCKSIRNLSTRTLSPSFED